METARDHFPKRLPIALANMAFIYGVMDDTEHELEYFLEAVEVVEANPDYYQVNGVKAMAYSALGDYYLRQEEFETAKKYFEQKLALAKTVNSKRLAYEAHGGLSTVYSSAALYDFERSKAHLDTVIAETDANFGHYRAQSQIRLGRLLRLEGRYEEAITNLKEARLFYVESQANDYLASAEKEMGEVYMATGQLAEARRWLQSSVGYARKNNLISRERNALKNLYKVDSMQGRYQSAFLNFLRMTQINDSLQSERSQNRINELQISYETEQKERENLALKSDLALKEAAEQRQFFLQIFITVVALVVIIIALILYRNYQRKKKDHDIIASQAEELKALSRFKEGLTGMVVHDMKDPINAIIGFSLGSPTEKKMKSINLSGHRILNLVNNMLDIQRFEEAKVELNAEVVSPAEIIKTVAQELQQSLQAKSLKIVNELPAGLTLRVDSSLLARIFTNLISNAVRYSDTGHDIVVKAGKSADGFMELSVIDFGAGIAPGELPHVFDKFWYKESGRSGISSSTGLGLAFCKLAVEAHGGEIRAESVLNKGTCVIFTMPLAQESVYASAEADSDTTKVETELLDVADLNILRPMLPALSGLKIHEVSAINKLIKELEAMGVNTRWTSDLQATVYQGDQKRYNLLLNQLAEGDMI